ncbi:CCNK [Mytilus edulis]|uniref:CCNK n=1 Tax=Mytilus edulis TaxID=6550 RepID=A0A8S3UYN8_MYTED|nr:CCNK [Mytilus edulis]
MLQAFGKGYGRFYHHKLTLNKIYFSKIRLITFQTDMPCWYFDKKEIRNTPTHRDGIDPTTEARYRREGARFIIDAGTKMGLRYDTCATGVVYFHRFYLFHSFKDFHRYITAAGCLFLAGKVEETPKKCKDIVKITQSILSPQLFSVFSEDPKEEIMTLERILLQTIKFDLQVDHPYACLLKFAKQVKIEKEKSQKLVQMAWTFINDSLCTTLCLQWEPEVIGISLMYLATRLAKFEISDWQGKPPGSKLKWWEGIVEDITVELMEDICHKVLDLYSKNPQQHEDSPPVTPSKSHRQTPPPPPPQKRSTTPADGAPDSKLARVDSRTTPKVKESNSSSDLRQTAMVNAASKSHSSDESSIQTIQTVGAAPTTEFSSYNPYMSQFNEWGGGGGGSSAENYPPGQQTPQGMAHYSQYPPGYQQASYAQAAQQQYSAQGQYPGYPQQAYPASQQVPGQQQVYPQGANYQQYQQGQQQFPGQYPPTSSVPSPYNTAGGQQGYQQQQQMINQQRGATSNVPRGTSTPRSSKSQTQSSQQGQNQNLAMVRITGR